LLSVLPFLAHSGNVETLEAETGLSLLPAIDLMGQAGSAATIAIAIDGTRMAIAVATLPRKSQPML
jgi:hypothetical protein